MVDNEYNRISTRIVKAFHLGNHLIIHDLHTLANKADGLDSHSGLLQHDFVTVLALMIKAGEVRVQRSGNAVTYSLGFVDG